MSGAVTKVVEIGGQNYTLTAKFGTARLAEKELGIPIPKLMSDVESIGFDAVSSLFWAFLQPKHMMTREGADNLIDECSVEQVTGWVGGCLAEYFGTDTKAGNVKKPAKRKAG